MVDQAATRTGRRRRWSAVSVAVATAMAVAMAAMACDSGAAGYGATPTPSARPSATPTMPPATQSPTLATIPQPAVEGLAVAPLSARVDLQVPTFSNPTEVTNPLFPVSTQASIVFAGHVDDKPFRTEVTLLPQTRIIEWQGQRVETLVSQYNAFKGGLIDEIAYDYYAQADDGSVWYFGEDVFDFQEGRIFGTQGTWLAGRDGPAAMIMPGHPRVGDVYRTENTPGVAFEEVTVKSVDQTFDGPAGPIHGGMVAEELHSDGTTEDKQFAPGYGEFFTGSGGDVEALALAVPTDALTGGVPAELTTLVGGAETVFEAARSRDWGSASAAAQEMAGAWDAYRAGGVPPLIEAELSDHLDTLSSAVAAKDATGAAQAAIDVRRWTLDLELRYRRPVEIDLARFDVWAAQMLLDAEAKDLGGVGADFFAIDYLRDRLLHAMTAADIARLDTQLEEAQTALADGDAGAAADAAAGLRDIAGSATLAA